MHNYSWAQNKLKLQRAINDVTAQSKLLGSEVKVNEESIKARYEQLGGLVLEDAGADVDGEVSPRRRGRGRAVEDAE